MNFLFVCSKNKWRSRTAETIFKNHPTHTVKSAGTENDARIKISEKLIVWADTIFVMERKHKEILLERFGEVFTDKEVVVLDIEDDYNYMDEELVEILNVSVEGYF